MPKRIDPEREGRVVALLAEGRRVVEIASIEGIDRDTVGAIRRRRSEDIARAARATIHEVKAAAPASPPAPAPDKFEAAARNPAARKKLTAEVQGRIYVRHLREADALERRGDLRAASLLAALREKNALRSLAVYDRIQGDALRGDAPVLDFFADVDRAVKEPVSREAERPAG